MCRYKQDSGVSPTITTILIVLMTVVAAATIAVVAMGLADTQPEHMVTLTVKTVPSGPDVVVTLYSSRYLLDLVQ